MICRQISGKKIGGYEIITYLCSIILKDIDYARDTENVWNEVLPLFTREHEPIHVHVKNSNGKAKFDIWPEGIVLVKNEGPKTKDAKAAEMVLEENRELAIEKWNEYFGRSVKYEDF